MSYLKKLFIVSLAMSPSLAFAECETDADCSAGEICVVEAIGTCSVDDMGNEVCDEEEYRACILAPYEPTECETDADCPSHLTCTDGGYRSVPIEECADEDCTGDEMIPIPCEEEDCQEPDIAEPAPSMCLYEDTICEADEDCPSNFHCTTYEEQVHCAVPDCLEGEDCPEIDCESYTDSYSVCEPDQIECDSDAACPADWSCVAVETYGEVGCGEIEPTDAGMASSNGSPGMDAPAPLPDTDEDNGEAADPAPEPVEEDYGCIEDENEVDVRQLCVPAGLNAYDVAYQEHNDTAEPGNLEDPTTREDDDDTSANNNGSTGNDTDGNTDDNNDGDTDDHNETDNAEAENTTAANNDVEEDGCSTQGAASTQFVFMLLTMMSLFTRRFKKGEQ